MKKRWMLYITSLNRLSKISIIVAALFLGIFITTASALTCSDCHDYPPVDNPTRDGSTGRFPGSHNKHAGTSNLNLLCTVCHINNGSNTAHRNGNIDMATPINGDGSASYSKGASFLQSNATFSGGACNSVYCHSTVQGANGTGAGTDKPQAWGAAGPIGCSACHADMSGASATGKHVKHTNSTAGNYNFACSTCHPAAYSASTTDDSLHANKTINVTIATGTYSGGATSGDHTPGGGYGSCSNVYCHSKGTVLSGGTYDQATNTPVVTPAWNTASLGCNGCHGDGVDTDGMPSYSNGTPKTNSHNIHVRTKGYVCVDCHSATVNVSNQITTPANHTNASYNVAGSLITTYTYSTTGGTCSSSCHMSSTPKWGQTSPGCTFCHATLLGKHSSHVVFTNTSIYGNTSANYSGSTTSYDFGCGNCHPTASASHMNGSIDLSLNPADGGTLKSRNVGPTISGSGLTTVCNNVYCHSDGKASPTFVSTPQWQNAFTNSLNTCGNCHGNSPTGANHQSHVVGIHYDTIYTGTTGLATAGTATANSHGNSAYSTTINCNLCHNSTVPSKARNMYGSTCSTAACHQGNTANTTNAMVTADLTKTMHVNGQPDVVFQTVNVKSRAQLRDDIATVTELNSSWTRTSGNYKAGATPYDQAKSALNTGTMWNGVSKTCSNIACHNGNAVTWSATLTCGSCHVQVTQ